LAVKVVAIDADLEAAVGCSERFVKQIKAVIHIRTLYRWIAGEVALAKPIC
jgi:hypothetical protein